MRYGLVLALAALALGCKKAEAVKEAADKARAGDTAPVHYVQGLQQDVKKAEDAAAKANAAIQKTDAQVDAAAQ